MKAFDDEVVSVIIPFLNGDQWLAEAIDSVLAQTCLNWEAILVDDGSQPEATAVAKDYSRRYPEKIIYTDHPHHKNKGVTASRNCGINLSKGSFIAFLDADDCWLPGKLLRQLKLFHTYPEAQMICEASRFWYSWNDSEASDEVVYVGAQPGKVYTPPELVKQLYPLGAGAPPCPTGIMIRKEAFNRSGGFEERFRGIYQLYEDQAFLSKIYLSESVYVSAEANNLYRKRPGSLTQAGNDEELYKTVRLFYLDWLDQYIADQGIGDAGIATLIIAARKKLKE